MNLDTNIRSDWSMVKLGEICEKAAKIKRKEVNPDEELIYLDIGGIDNRSNCIISHKKYQWKDAPSRAQQIVKVGDTLFSTVRTYLKNIAMVDNSEFENQICSSGFTVIRSINELANSKYLFALSLSEGFLEPLNKLQTGTSYPAVRDKDVFGQIIPLPPLSEQEAIVSKIEQLFSDLDNGIENFKKAQEQLKFYRKAVLKNACEGKLVPIEAELARSEGRDYEPADVLLARILEERREKWDSKGKYKEPVTPDTNGLAELPEGWGWATIGAASEIIMGQSPPGESYNVTGLGTPLINGPVEFGPNPFSKTIKAKFTTAPKKMCKEDDLILCVRGSTTGRMNISGFDACIGRGVAAIKGFINQWYLNYYIHFNQKNFFNMGTGTTFPNINSNHIAEYPIPLPPLIEQQRIVTEVEHRLSICDKMEETISQSLQKAESLRQSILKRAFEGKLLNEKELEEVRSSPDWEPAEKLLERIKAEKTNTKAKKRGKK